MSIIGEAIVTQVLKDSKSRVVVADVIWGNIRTSTSTQLLRAEKTITECTIPRLSVGGVVVGTVYKDQKFAAVIDTPEDVEVGDVLSCYAQGGEYEP